MARKHCPFRLSHKMGKTGGYPLKLLQVIHLFPNNHPFIIYFCMKRRGNDEVLQLCLFIKNFKKKILSILEKDNIILTSSFSSFKTFLILP